MQRLHSKLAQLLRNVVDFGHDFAYAVENMSAVNSFLQIPRQTYMYNGICHPGFFARPNYFTQTLDYYTRD